MREERTGARILKNLLYAGLVIAVAAVGFIILMNTAFVIRTIDVEGCTYSDADLIAREVQTDEYSENSLMLFLQLKTGKQPQIDFVDEVQVSFISPWHICLNVTEKTLYGVMYDADTQQYTYFDSAGTVVEISETSVSDILELNGTTSGDAVAGESLKLLPKGSISYVTEVFGLIGEYELDVYSVYVDSDGMISFDTSGITISLGSDENTAEKFSNLVLILDQLDGMSGTLDLSAFEEAGDDIIFTQE